MLEQRRNIAEEKLLSGVISDEAFRRQAPRIVSELAEISRKLQDIDAGRNLDTEALRQILLFARDIPNAYSQAPRRLKRIYLEFFFKEIVLQDKQIVRIEPTEFFAALQAGKQVRTFSNWRPGLNAILTVIRLLKTPSWLEKQKETMQKATEIRSNLLVA